MHLKYVEYYLVHTFLIIIGCYYKYFRNSGISPPLQFHPCMVIDIKFFLLAFLSKDVCVCVCVHVYVYIVKTSRSINSVLNISF